MIKTSQTALFVAEHVCLIFRAETEKCCFKMFYDFHTISISKELKVCQLLYYQYTTFIFPVYKNILPEGYLKMFQCQSNRQPSRRLCHFIYHLTFCDVEEPKSWLFWHSLPNQTPHQQYSNIKAIIIPQYYIIYMLSLMW